MLATILALTILNSQGEVTYKSQPRSSNFQNYDHNHKEPSVSQQELQQKRMEKYNEDSQRMRQQSDDYYFQQSLLNALKR